MQDIDCLEEETMTVQRQCPNCGSYKTTRRSPLLWFGLGFLALAVLAFVPVFLISQNASANQLAAIQNGFKYVGDRVAVTWATWSLVLLAVGAVSIILGFTTGRLRCGGCGLELDSFGSHQGRSGGIGLPMTDAQTAVSKSRRDPGTRQTAVQSSSPARRNRFLVLATVCVVVVAAAVAVVVLRPPAANSGPVSFDEAQWVLQGMERNGVGASGSSQPTVSRDGADQYLVEGAIIDRLGNEHSRAAVWNQGQNLVVLYFDDSVDAEGSRAMKAVLKSKEVVEAVDPEYITAFDLESKKDGFAFRLMSQREGGVGNGSITVTGVARKTLIGYTVKNVQQQ